MYDIGIIVYHGQNHFWKNRCSLNFRDIYTLLWETIGGKEGAKNRGRGVKLKFESSI